MALLQVTVLPLGTGTPSVSKFVAEAVRIAEDSGITYRITPMSTCLEGSLAEVVSVAVQMHEACFDENVQRVVTAITIDDRRDKETTLHHRVAAIEENVAER